MIGKKLKAVYEDWIDAGSARRARRMEAECSMNVPFFVPEIGEAEKRAVLEVLDSGWLTTGARTKTFERAFAEEVRAPHALAVNSCTAALHLALEALGIGRGDRVLVPSFTFAATAEVVRYLDAVPVFVDSRESDGNLCLESAESICAQLLRAGTPAKAIIPMHYGGQMVDMPGVALLARRYGLKVIEDAAHAVPAWLEHEGQRIFPGSLSDAACFSFYANKTMTTGEGGMVVARDEGVVRRMRIMSLHGIDRDAYARYSATGSPHYEIVAAGYKYNLTDIAAALGVEQLRKANAMRDARARVAGQYLARLKGVDELRCLDQDPRCHNSWHLFVVRVLEERSRLTRDELVAALKARGITTSIHWKALHLMPYYALMPQVGRPVTAERLSREVISLPIFPSMTEEQVDFVVRSAVEAVQS